MKLSMKKVAMPLVGIAVALIALFALQSVFANTGDPVTTSATYNASTQTLRVFGTYNCANAASTGLSQGFDVFTMDTIGANFPNSTGGNDLNGSLLPTSPGAGKVQTFSGSAGGAGSNCTTSGVKPYDVSYTLATRPKVVCLVVYHTTVGQATGFHSFIATGPGFNSDNSYNQTGGTKTSPKPANSYGGIGIDCAVPPQSKLTPDKKADADNVDAGTDIGFTISVRNPADGVASAGTIHDLLPGGNGINWFITSQGAVANGTCAITGTNPNQVLDCGPLNDVPAQQLTALFVVHVESTTNLASSGFNATSTPVCPPPTNVVTYNNSATANSKNQDNPITSPTVSESVNCLATTLDKDVAAASDVKITANYTYEETNNSNVALSNVSVSDNKCAPVVSSDTGNLAAGATRTFTCSHTYTLGSAEGVCTTSTDCNFTNVATGSGTTPLNHVVTDCGNTPAGTRICDPHETDSTTIHVAITVGTSP